MTVRGRGKRTRKGNLQAGAPYAGIVEFGHSAINQRGETVAECTRQALMRKRPKS